MSHPKYDDDLSSSSSSSSAAAAASAILNNVLENFKNLPASTNTSTHFSSTPWESSSSQGRLFGREKPLHDLFGGGRSADVLLWRKKHLSAGFLAGATAIWVLFEWIGYHFVSVVSLLLLVAVTSLFVWSNGAAFFNRSPPPVPKFELSDEVVLKVARTLKLEINRVLAVLHEIAIGRDVKRFSKTVGVLVLLLLFGSWFNFLTLVFLVVVAAHTLPVLYEKNEDAFDRLAQTALNEFNHQYRKVDASLLSKIPRGPAVQKKTE